MQPEASEARTQMDRVLLRDLEFYAYHGVREAEKQLGQRFLIDLDLQLDLRSAGASDDLTQTVSYSEVYRMVREIVEGPPRNLLEAVAEEIARKLLDRYDRLAAVRVCVKKPSPPIAGGHLGFAGVVISRGRAEI